MFKQSVTSFLSSSSLIKILRGILIRVSYECCTLRPSYSPH